MEQLTPKCDFRKMDNDEALAVVAQIKGQHITFAEAARHLMESPLYPYFDMGDPPSERDSTEMDNHVWHMAAEGNESIAFVYVDQDGRYGIV